MVPEGTRENERGGGGEDDAGLGYWKNRADEMERRANELQEQIDTISAPMILRFRGTDGGMMWERDLYKMPVHCWDRAVELDPHIEDWNRVSVGGLLLALCPTSSVTPLAVINPVFRDH